MPTFLDGSYNLAALSVPGVYVDIIPPSPNIIGVPTNIEGIVGVGSWGPLNTPIPISKPADAATKIGTPLIRSHDLATYVWAGTQVGGAIGYYAVRVSDGTDTAASANIQASPPIPATAVFSQTGVNNFVGATFASVVFTETSSNNFLANDTITVGNDTYKFVATIGATAGNVLLGANFAASAANLVAAINNTGGSGTTYINPAIIPNVIASNTSSTITFTSLNLGTAGNSLVSTYTPTSTAAGVFGGATLSGGLNGDTITVGNDTYKFVTAILGSTPGLVLVGANYPASAANLIAGINNTGGAGTIYSLPTIIPNVSASFPSAGTILFTALVGGVAGNAFVSTYSPIGTAAGTFAGSTLSGGINATVGLTLTAKYSGILGNSIIYNVANGTQAGSYLVTLSFPGVSPEQYNNIGQGIGSIMTVAGTAYTSVPSATVSAPPVAANAVQAVVNPVLSIYGTPVLISGGTSGFAVNDLLYFANGVILKAATVASGVVTAITVQSAGQITGGAAPTGTQFMTSTSGAGVGAVSCSFTWGLGSPVIVTPGQGYLVAPTITLSGGGGAGGSYTATLSIWLNLANAINNGNATRGPSQIVTASAGAGITAPPLSTPITLAGGTDGAAGVTDATLVGQDIIPRKGMYALRSTGIDGFSLCDLSTPSYFPVIDSFSVSENALAVHATVSGDTIANAIATLTSSGLDDFPAWLIVGDWPTFYDSQNALSRLVNPAAFALGLIGNLSPEQSPINKPLRGISATQKTQSGQTYSDTELSAAELGRVDLIVGPPTTPGGNYYSFITGRNTSSNTAGNGIEYSRMTWFIARSVQSKAAGSIVGRLQSIRPNDKTRSDAKALLDGFFAQLADPAYGSQGNGLIDQWSVQCDLNNNTPATQALGYLFAYCTVRYLNIVRYFVVKLAGGGNANVTVQSTPPTPSQFS